MTIDARPHLADIVLIHDKILIALLGANNIKPVEVFVSGWLHEPQEFQRELYMAYKQTDRVMHIIKQFDKRTVSVDLDAYMSSLEELGGQVGQIMHWPKRFEIHRDEA